MCCKDVPPPPDWPLERKREYVAYWEDIDADEVTDDLIEQYEWAIGLEGCLAFYGALVVPQDYFDRYCCSRN